MLEKLKSNKGITGVDATVAIVILMIFVPLVASLFYNIASVKKSSERKLTAFNIAMQVVEGIKMKDYDSIKPGITIDDALGQSGNYNAVNIPNGFEVGITIIEQDGDEPGKEVRVVVSYLEKNNKEKVELKTKILASSEDDDRNIGVNAQVTKVEGETIEYEFSVTNIGTKTLRNIKIYEGVKKPYNEQTINVDGELDSNETSRTYKGTFIANENGDWSSYIKVTATTSDGEEIEFTTRLHLCEIVINDEMTVELVEERGPENGNYYDVGQTVEFKTIVKNTGTTTLRGITINSPKGLERNVIERLEPGKAKEISGYTYTIKNEDVGKGTISYTINVESAEPRLSKEITATAKVVPALPSMSILFAETSHPKNGTSYNYNNNENIDFKITLKNTGNTPLKNLKVNFYIGSLTGIAQGRYDHVYSWGTDGTDPNKGNIDFALTETKEFNRSVTRENIRPENYTGEKRAFIEIVTEDGTTQRSDYITINLSNNR